MDPKLQRRIQRYGWDLAAETYEPAWSRQISQAHAEMLSAVAPRPGERVLDVACGTGLVSFAAAAAVAPDGSVLGVDLSGAMVESCRRRAVGAGRAALSFQRMDAEALQVAAGDFDIALCALGLMYMPDPVAALAEMARALRPGGRLGLAVWGEREACGWSPIFDIVDAEVASDVCPLFFRLGGASALAEACAEAGFVDVRARRIRTLLCYPTAEMASEAAFVGGPVALAWSRFDSAARARATSRYLQRIAVHRVGAGYALPGEFLIVSAFKPDAGGRGPHARRAHADA